MLLLRFAITSIWMSIFGHALGLELEISKRLVQSICRAKESNHEYPFRILPLKDQKQPAKEYICYWINYCRFQSTCNPSNSVWITSCGRKYEIPKNYYELISNDTREPPDGDGKQAAVDRRWPNRTLVFAVDSQWNPIQLDRIRFAIGDIMRSTGRCIKFKLRTNETDFLYITKGSPGCFSYVGHYSGQQILNLEPPACIDVPVITHEIVHALGFYHEHCRHDRDEYVDVFYENIQEGAKREFDIKPADVAPTLGVPYDYISIMHYPDYAFSVSSSKKTILAKNGAQLAGIEMSKYDARKLKTFYDCPSA